ncbi:MAG: hypothetical protein HQ402_01575 [Parcubacteria group bacterium]|nr:hypothetical protein [Parcubacteria group bacterium]
MSIFNFFKNSKDNKNIIYVLDRLHDFAVRDWKHKNIDFNLYKVLNSPEVYQEAIHMGLYPIVGENKEASPEFIQFINNLWLYIEYDVNTDFLWAKTTDNPSAQKNIHEKISQARKEILQYLLNKKLISNEQYLSELNHKVKSLVE